MALLLFEEVEEAIFSVECRAFKRDGHTPNIAVYMTQESYHCMVTEMRSHLSSYEPRAQSFWESEIIKGYPIYRVVGAQADKTHPPYRVVELPS